MVLQFGALGNILALTQYNIELGVGKFTPNAGVEGDMGWTPTEVRLWNCVIRLWGRLKILT